LKQNVIYAQGDEDYKSEQDFIVQPSINQEPVIATTKTIH
jgi:hypothetical protein